MNAPDLDGVVLKVPEGRRQVPVRPGGLPHPAQQVPHRGLAHPDPPEDDPPGVPVLEGPDEPDGDDRGASALLVLVHGLGQVGQGSSCWDGGLSFSSSLLSLSRNFLLRQRTSQTSGCHKTE